MMHFEIITQSGSCGAYDLTVFSGETKGDFGLRLSEGYCESFLDC